MRYSGLFIIFLASALVLESSFFTLARAEEPPAGDACLPHLSCQTCLQEDSCVWCVESEQCVNSESAGPNTTCPDAIDECDCSAFQSCDSCLGPGYCEWCESFKKCYSAGDRPMECTNFREQICAERVGLTTEYGILASMVVIVLALLAAVITVYAVKWVKRPKDAGGLHQHEEESRSLDTMSSMQYLTEDEDTADESDSLLPSPTKPAAAAPRRRFPS